MLKGGVLRPRGHRSTPRLPPAHWAHVDLPLAVLLWSVLVMLAFQGGNAALRKATQMVMVADAHTLRYRMLEDYALTGAWHDLIRDDEIGRADQDSKLRPNRPDGSAPGEAASSQDQLRAAAQEGRSDKDPAAQADADEEQSPRFTQVASLGGELKMLRADRGMPLLFSLRPAVQQGALPMVVDWYCGAQALPAGWQGPEAAPGNLPQKELLSPCRNHPRS